MFKKKVLKFCKMMAIGCLHSHIYSSSSLINLQRRELSIFMEWFIRISNLVNKDRVKLVGPDCACAEWVLRNGAQLRFKGESKFLFDYNELMLIEKTQAALVKVEEIYGENADLHDWGFEHLKNCRDVKKITLISCPFVGNLSLLILHYVKDSLQYLEIKSCPRVKDEGLIELCFLSFGLLIKCEGKPLKEKKNISLSFKSKTKAFMIRLMEASESGDDLGAAFLTDGTYMVHGDDLEDDVDGNLSAENTDDDVNENKEKIGAPLREQDRFLPIANVAKIMKRAVPELGKIAKDARECVQECVSEFISFITSEASDRCHMEKRKTINGEDILFAMTTLGFDNYVEPLKIYLQKYREATKGDRPTIEEIYENKVFNAGVLPDASNADTVIYAYPEQMQPFQLP